MPEQTYYVKGMHCAACEVLIEKKLLDVQGVKAVDASTPKGEITVEYEGEKPDASSLNTLFGKDNYSFSESKTEASTEPANSTLFGLAIATVIVMVFLALDRMGISGLLNISSSSSAATFFGFGILAGLSSCAALVGGIILSLSKQWDGMYAKEHKTYQKFEPHFMFNAGRIISYALLGGVLGLIGSRLSISLTLTSWLVIAISLFMTALGLQMLNVKGFRGFQLRMPKSITRGIANERHFTGKYMPFLMGAATFFLPCGFTITAQTIALLSGNALQGALIMGCFALGTAPMLLLIGLSSVAFYSKARWADIFSRTAGFLVLFFALYNIYNQLGVLGLIIH